ncbi:uncharacterized protein LOC126766448 [Bactrocera neohumeralis]|uniref:uncharacterized protein LOC126766448 n=1 Tax=Bactrocera neohumeralis TaxID=98809 RepID=UPI002165D07C|nr:uncharacterized protein LOC126766448 [Bactrocera neohumeralis]
MKRKAGAICSVAAIISLLLNSGEAPINRAGLELIGEAEQCRTMPYVCPAGVLTDGIGNTQHNVVAGQQKSFKQIARDWGANINTASMCVRRQFRGDDMNENQFAAFTSVAFRTGCTGLRTYYNAKLQRRVETTIHKLAMQGRFTEACDRITDFVNGGGKPLPGLVARAEKEKALCLKSVNK